MFCLCSDGWYFEDEEGYMHGPFKTKEVAQTKCVERLGKRYAKPCEGDLVEVKD